MPALDRSLPTALARLYALAPRGARLGLDAMREACAREGDPHDRLRAVHVAGTNGKGSVCASLESIARAAGLKTALYTSPHLGRFAERIRLNGAPIADDVLARTLSQAMDAHPELTFFEIATLTAFSVFAVADVDLTIVEVGLGGRLDATNVLTAPLVTAITGIAIDHTAYLGTSIASIAREKAGILKRGVPLVTGRLVEDAHAVVGAAAAEVQVSELLRLGDDFMVEAAPSSSDAIVVRDRAAHALTATPSLFGAHQRDNAAVAVAIAWLLRERAGPLARIDDAAIARGLASVRWPGRFELLDRTSTTFPGRFILDGAHNLDGARALAAALLAHDEGRGRRALVFGAMDDKPWSEMIEVLRDGFEARVYVQANAVGGGRHGATGEALQRADPGSIAARNLPEALALARACVGESGTVVVAGSLYLVGEARALLLDEPRDPQVGL